LTAGESLTETAKQFTQCDGENTGVLKLIPPMVEPYAECGGVTAGLLVSKYVSN